MRTVFIPRGFHETYFMPAGPLLPSAGEKVAYLSAHHPLYGPQCIIDSRRCRIAGRAFLMLTVLNVPLRALRSGTARGRLVTVPSILAASRLARSPCTIRCGEELVVFGPQSESIPAPVAIEGMVRADHEFADEAVLSAFAEKERIRISLFRSRWRLPAIFLTAGLCIVLTAFMAVPSPDAVAVRESLLTGTVPAVARTSFPAVFASVVDAAAGIGAVIEEYRYSTGEEADTRIAFKKGNPEALRAALLAIPAIGAIAMGDLRYAESTWRYSASFSSGTAGPGDAKAGGPGGWNAGFEDEALNVERVRGLEKLCLGSGWILSAASEGERPILAITVPASSFHLFPEALFSHCAETGRAVTSFCAKRTGNGDSLTVRIELAVDPAGNGNVARPPEPERVRSAFGLAPPARKDRVRASSGSRGGTVGKIEDSSRGLYVFARSPSGKITVEKETNK